MSSQKQICFVCQKGFLQRSQRLFVKADPHWECNHCHVLLYWKDNKYLLKNVPAKTPWKKYEGWLLSWEEIQRIMKGGLSNREIAEKEAKEEEERKRRQQLEEERRRLEQIEEQKTQALLERRQREQLEEQKRQEQLQEERKQREQHPGTPENYQLRFRNILGVPEGQTEFVMEIKAQSADEVKQNIKNIIQMQKELRQLKKEIAVTKKTLRSTYLSARAASWRGSTKDSVLGPYDDLTTRIDSTIVSLDGAKVEIENRASGFDFGTKPTQSQPRITQTKGQPKNVVQATDESMENLLDELNSLVGLDSVKSEVQELVNFLKIQQVRKARNLPTAGLSLHVVFYGNPGTGKTTVARLLSRIYRALGVVSRGHLIETDRSGMVAGYVGQTALKVTEVVEQALGGVLFIDEAYSLTDGDEGGYGREAIDTLIKLMEDHREDLAVVIAGYTGKIEKFLSTNPGLKSRFNRYWKFEDYTPQQLLSIFESFCIKGQFRLSPGAQDKLRSVLQTAYERRDESFGNARLVRNLYESSISNQASRIVGYKKITDDVLTTIEAEDVPNTVETM
jgi:Holliday junction resolvasome RuvABC ATP-dependent DNA helicase subunit